MNSKNIKWFKQFVKICDVNNIEYVLFYGTLLGVIRNKGLIPWDDDFDVVMTMESYEKLKKLFPKHCLDTSVKKEFPSLIQKFLPDVNNYLNSTIFVDIFLIIDSNNEKMKNNHK